MPVRELDDPPASTATVTPSLQSNGETQALRQTAVRLYQAVRIWSREENESYLSDMSV